MRSSAPASSLPSDPRHTSPTPRGAIVYPENLKYTSEHEWVRTPGEADGSVRVGITDFAQDALGDIVYVSLPQVGDQVAAGETCGELESTKSVSDIYAPVTGEVVATNAALDSTPELVNSDPYEAGWLFEVTVADDSQLDGLMDAAAYQSGLDG
ncbi:glycine cleavage system protein GcvH [Nocardioides sp. zg-1228]|nr:glycine cleavage system protein GcvH [Nocardioides sp. zg-1228]QSF55997.1 glycine cleavage system protein GcvH [Nocardioides sp. zg-1228]